MVIATRRAPSLAPGLMEQGDTPEIRELASKLRVVADEAKLGDALHAALAPDMAAAPEIGFVHRQLAVAEIYFLVNTTNHAVHAKRAVSRSGCAGGMVGYFQRQRSAAPAANAMELDLAPYESRVMVFSHDRRPRPRPRAGRRQSI